MRLLWHEFTLMSLAATTMSNRALKLRLVGDVVAGEEKHGGKRRRFGPSFTVEVQDASTTGFRV
jgi:hypothetical protein